MGASLGAKQIPEHWIKPLNDKLYSAVIGFHPIAISECQSHLSRDFGIHRQKV